MPDAILLIIIITAPVSAFALGVAAYHAWREVCSHHHDKERRP